MSENIQKGKCKQTKLISLTHNIFKPQEIKGKGKNTETKGNKHLTYEETKIKITFNFSETKKIGE